MDVPSLKRSEVDRVLRMLEAAGTLTGDDAIETGLFKMSAQELHGLAYRIERALAEVYELGQREDAK